ncbi:MAG: sensor histidine kinase [Planktomarina sp.]
MASNPWDMMTNRSPLYFAIFALFACIASVVAYSWVEQQERAMIRTTSELRLDQAVGRLTAQLQVYRVLVNTVAKDPRVVSALQNEGAARRIGATLRNQSLTFGLDDIYLVSANGTIVATADLSTTRLITTDTPLLTAALNGRLGLDYFIASNGNRYARFARGVLGQTAGKAGAVVIWVNLSELEFEWPVAPEDIVFVDANRVIATNRAALEAVALDALSFEPDRLLVMQSVPQIGLNAIGSFDPSLASETARQQALLVLLTLGVFGLLAFAWLQQRRRLEFEAATNATLEARVIDRTQALQAAQDQLVQASKLTALGQMSAGVSHELNQPLAAILTYAQNGKTLLDRGRVDDAGENLAQIETQIHRINRMIAVLRTFARNEAVPREPVNVTAAINAAIEMVTDQAKRQGVQIVKTGDWSNHMVLGGRVRLEQVMLNLMSNALDAMSDETGGTLTLHLNDWIQISVTDTGLGIADPERVFEPFYTTKDLGASKGLGLGLALSFGIIESFEGHITCHNAPSGGAVFTVNLPSIQ